MSKSFCLLYLALKLSPAVALAQHHPHHPPAEPASVHGMLLFGTKTLYAHHLPMFHHPHDQQVIWEVQLAANVKEKYLSAHAANPEAVFTIVPEIFVLTEMALQPRPFKAALFLGHFERGGQLLLADVVVNPTNTVLQKKLSSSPAAGQSLWYLLGNADEAFLIHDIQGKPNFDQVVQISFSGPTKVPANGPGKIFEIAGLSPAHKLVSGQSVEIQNEVGSLSLIVTNLIYLETSDLSF